MSQLNPYAPPSHDEAPPPAPHGTFGYRESRLLVQATTFLLAGCALIALIKIWSKIEVDDQLAAIAAGRHDELAYVTSAVRERVLDLIDALLRVLTGVVFCVFVHRMNRNALALGAQGMAFTAGAVVWSFFIPIVSLWRPLGAVREIWDASAPEHDGYDWRRNQTPGLLTAWWAAWLLTSVLGGVAAMNADVRPEIGAMIKHNRMLMTVLVPDVAAAVLAMLVVRGIAARQQQRAVGLSSPRVWQPAAPSGPDVDDDELPEAAQEQPAPPPRRRRRRRREPPAQ